MTHGQLLANEGLAASRSGIAKALRTAGRPDDLEPQLLAIAVALQRSVAAPKFCQPHEVRAEIHDAVEAAKEFRKAIRGLSNDARWELAVVTELPSAHGPLEDEIEFELYDPISDISSRLDEDVEHLDIVVKERPAGEAIEYPTIALEVLVNDIEAVFPTVSNRTLTKLAAELFDPVLPAPGDRRTDDPSKPWQAPRWKDRVRRARQSRRQPATT